ncbi:MAG TPA: hypothetical protein VGY31_07620 [Terriglobia bacterium]|nr:hypothetical protein [Terriglobia bacterium]
MEKKESDFLRKRAGPATIASMAILAAFCRALMDAYKKGFCGKIGR